MKKKKTTVQKLREANKRNKNLALENADYRAYYLEQLEDAKRLRPFEKECEDLRADNFRLEAQIITAHNRLGVLIIEEETVNEDAVLRDPSEGLCIDLSIKGRQLQLISNGLMITGSSNKLNHAVLESMRRYK